MEGCYCCLYEIPGDQHRFVQGRASSREMLIRNTPAIWGPDYSDPGVSWWARLSGLFKEVVVGLKDRGLPRMHFLLDRVAGSAEDIPIVPTFPCPLHNGLSGNALCAKYEF